MEIGLNTHRATQFTMYLDLGTVKNTLGMPSSTRRKEENNDSTNEATKIINEIRLDVVL
ncbi:hypothetical protein LAV80_21585 [Bacillus wiedmannii]